MSLQRLGDTVYASLYVDPGNGLFKGTTLEDQRHGNKVVQGYRKTLMLSRYAYASTSIDQMLRKLATQQRNYEDDRMTSPWDVLDEGQYILEQEGRTPLLLGEMVRDRSSLSNVGDRGRYVNDPMRAQILAVAALTLGVPKAHIFLATNVPGSMYTAEYEDQVKAYLSGQHAFSLNGKKYNYTIETMAVYQEGAVAAPLLCNKDRGLQVILDIGQWTTDGYVVKWNPKTRKFQVEDHLCFTIPRGVQSIFDVIKNSAAAKNIVLDISMMETMLEEHTASLPHSSFSIRGETVSPEMQAEWIQVALHEVFQIIRSACSGKWGGDSSSDGGIGINFSTFTIIGGGYKPLFTRFNNDLGGQVTVLQGDPQFKNAEGGALRAERFLIRAMDAMTFGEKAGVR